MPERQMIDESMDALLRETLSADPPLLSRRFEVRVIRRARPRRLTSSGRMLMTLYAVAALAVAGWVMRDVPIEWIGASIALTLPVAGALAGYASIMNHA